MKALLHASHHLRGSPGREGEGEEEGEEGEVSTEAGEWMARKAIQWSQPKWSRDEGSPPCQVPSEREGEGRDAGGRWHEASGRHVNA